MASTVTRPPKLHELSDDQVTERLTQYVPMFNQRMDRAAGDLVGDLEEIIDYRLWEKAGYATLNDYAKEQLKHSEDWCREVIRIYNNDWTPVQRASATIEELNRAEKAKAVKAAVTNAMAENPGATQEQIAEKVGLSQQRVQQITSEIQANEPPKLLKHGGKREKQVANSPVAKTFQASKKSSTSPERIKARLTRDAEANPKAKEVLEELELGSTTARQAALKMGWVKPPDIVKQVEKQREKLSVEDQVKIWEQWGRSIPDEAMDRIGIAKEAFLNLDESSQNEFLAWANSVTGGKNGN